MSPGGLGHMWCLGATLWLWAVQAEPGQTKQPEAAEKGQSHNQERPESHQSTDPVQGPSLVMDREGQTSPKASFKDRKAPGTQ